MYAFDYQHDHSTKILDLKFKPCTVTVQPFDKEVLRAAELNANKGKTVVMFSGGIDSELIVRAMHEIGADFKVVSFAYNNWHNSTDIWYAQQCCKELGLEHHIIDFDLDEFIRTGMDKYIDDGYCATNIYRLTQIEFIKRGSELGDFVVMGSGEQRFCMVNSITGMYMVYGFANSMEYAKKHGINCNPFFYYSTPELIAAYHEIPIVKWSFTQPDYYNNGAATYATKTIAYHSVYPNMMHRRKLNGFEQLSIEMKALSDNIMKTRCAAMEFHLFIPLTDLLNQLHCQ